MTHPSFLNQPFFKVPNAHPNDDIDFRAGEVVYENPQAVEWARLGLMAQFNFAVYFAIYWPFASNRMTSLSSKDMLEGYYTHYKDFSLNEIDVFGVLPVLFPLFTTAIVFIMMKLSSLMAKPFIQKIQYNRNKDLVFITSLNQTGGLEEKAYELANIEHCPPTTKGYRTTMSAFTKGGFINLTALDKKENFFVSTDDDKWNPKLKGEFMKSVSNMWDVSLVDEILSDYVDK